MKNKLKTMATTEAVDIKVLKAELETSKALATQMQTVAQESINRLLVVEDKLSPQLLRKPSFWNILFHWREVISVIAEIIKIIKDFKEALNKKPDVDNQ